MLLEHAGNMQDIVGGITDKSIVLDFNIEFEDLSDIREDLTSLIKYNYVTEKKSLWLGMDMLTETIHKSLAKNLTLFKRFESYTALIISGMTQQHDIAQYITPVPEKNVTVHTISWQDINLSEIFVWLY